MVLNRDEQRGELGNQRQQVFFWGSREADSEPVESSLRDWSLITERGGGTKRKGGGT